MTTNAKPGINLLVADGVNSTVSILTTFVIPEGDPSVSLAEIIGALVVDSLMKQLGNDPNGDKSRLPPGKYTLQLLASCVDVGE